MAERYAEEAHRAYVFACIAAATFGSKVIETEHLLLGILREDMAFVNRFMIPEVSVDTIRHLIQARVTVREMIPATSDISLGDEGNRVYSFAAEEAHLMGREQIGIEHLLLGLLREKNCLASQLLCEHGADFERIRKELATAPYQPPMKKERMRREIKRLQEILAATSQQQSLNLKETSLSASKLNRYTEKARRTIFFARYEASQFFSPVIETEHLLLGVLREDKAHLDLYLPSTDSIATIRKQIEEHSVVSEKSLPNEKLSARMDLTLSDECERVLAYAEEEAGKLGHERIVPAHLILGLLMEEDSFAAQLLREHGAEIGRIRSGLTANPKQPLSNPADPSEPPSSQQSS